MKIINGQILKQMLISGSNNLYNFYPEVDALNVFPVPDGDTGMNMNLTLTSGSKEIQNRNDNSVYEIAKAFSRGLLMGARGNSGVITSQIFRGFAQGLEGKEEINAVEETPISKEEEAEIEEEIREEEKIKESGYKGPRIYHMSKRREDNMWQVKFASGKRAIKLFSTQAEAIVFAKKLAKSQDGSIRVHSLKGKIRKSH